MFARLLIPLYAIVSHAVLAVPFRRAVGFVGNCVAPKSIGDGSADANAARLTNRAFLDAGGRARR